MVVPTERVGSWAGPGRVILLGILLSLPFSLICGALDLATAQTSPVHLDTLQVRVGSRVSPQLPLLTRSVQLLDRDRIEALPVRTVAGLLRWATGVEIQARSPAQSDLSVRGAGFEQVVVLVDGVRMSDPQTGHFDLDLTVPLDQVARVEILRGPASALYGADAVGGVVNVVTREGKGGWRGRVEGGSWGTARVSIGGGVRTRGGTSLEVGGEIGRSDGHRRGTDFETAMAHASLRRSLGPGRVTGTAGLSRRDYGAQGFYAPYPSFEKTRTYSSALRWSSIGTGKGRAELGGSYRRHEDEFTLIRNDPGAYQNRHTSSQVGGDVLVLRNVGETLELAVGGEAFRHILRSNSLGDRGENRGAIFCEAVLGGKGPAVGSLGLRQDWHQGFGAFLSPSLSASVRSGSGFRLRAAIGRSFRAPTWTERYYQDPVNVGREDLAAERAWSGELGADIASAGAFHLSATAFARRAEALIDWARPVGAAEDTPWETRNVEKATFRGLEVDAKIQGPLGIRWTLGGSVLSVRSEEAGGYRSKYALRPLEEQWNAGLSRTLSGGLTASLNTQRARRKGQDPYHLVDLRFAYRFGDLRIHLDATNLLDADYPDITGFRAPGRGFFLGLEVESR